MYCRCANNPLIGRPSKVTTVDKYQGQQNDYILLSLVKTRAVGHLRDARRLVVAMSRARLGLYVFARVSLFKNCFELTPAFHQLMRRPLKLQLLPHEDYPTQRLNDDESIVPPIEIDDMPHAANFVYEFYTNKVKGMKEAQKEWAKPGTTHKPASPEHHVPVHPGADDNGSDDEEQNKTINNPVVKEILPVEKSEPVQTMMNEPIENLVEETMETD